VDRARQSTNLVRAALRAVAITLAIVSLVLLAVAVVLLVPQYVVDHLYKLPKPLSEGAEVDAIDTVRLHLLYVLGGVIAILGLVYTHARNRRERVQLDLLRSDNVTGRFTAAVGQLGGSMDVRVGAVYALERIARDSSDDASTIQQILCAYVREHTRGTSSDQVQKAVDADVDACLDVLLLRQNVWPEEHRLTFSNISFARLSGARLASALLNQAELRGAQLDDADLAGARLNYSDLRAANLRGANLSGANLTHVDLTFANLSGANLSHSDITGANFANARLAGARFVGDERNDPALPELILAEARWSPTVDPPKWPLGFEPPPNAWSEKASPEGSPQSER
jgi:hypothetical protein